MKKNKAYTAENLRKLRELAKKREIGKRKFDIALGEDLRRLEEGGFPKRRNEFITLLESKPREAFGIIRKRMMNNRNYTMKEVERFRKLLIEEEGLSEEKVNLFYERAKNDLRYIDPVDALMIKLEYGGRISYKKIVDKLKETGQLNERTLLRIEKEAKAKNINGKMLDHSLEIIGKTMQGEKLRDIHREINKREKPRHKKRTKNGKKT